MSANEESVVTSLQNAVFRNNLQTLILPRFVHLYTQSDLLSLFPSLLSLQCHYSKHDYAIISSSSFLAKPHITSLTLWHTMSVSPSPPPADVTSVWKSLDLSGFIALQQLNLVYDNLSTNEFTIILTLPALQTLELNCTHNRYNTRLFHPDTYPITNVAPLKTLKLHYNAFHSLLEDTEMKLCALLDRFQSLDLLILPSKRYLSSLSFSLDNSGDDSSTILWEQLQKPCLYRVTIIYRSSELEKYVLHHNESYQPDYYD